MEKLAGRISRTLHLGEVVRPKEEGLIETGTEGGSEVGHFREIADPHAVDPAENLSGPESRISLLLKPCLPIVQGQSKREPTCGGGRLG